MARPVKKYFLAESGVTLIELIVVVIIISIVAGFATIQFARSRERTMDKQAQAILTSIRAGQRVYIVEAGFYYTPGATTVSALNSNLSIDLYDTGIWGSYNISSTGGFNASVSRNSAGFNRRWWISPETENATCVPIGGSQCP